MQPLLSKPRFHTYKFINIMKCIGITENICAIPPTRKNIPVEGLLPIILEDSMMCKIPAIAVEAAAA